MTKAKMELSNGTKIIIEGTSEEVSKTIQLMQGTTNPTNKKRTDSPLKKETKKKSYSGPSGGIKLLIDEGFFD